MSQKHECYKIFVSLWQIFYLRNRDGYATSLKFLKHEFIKPPIFYCRYFFYTFLHHLNTRCTITCFPYPTRRIHGI